MEEHSTLPKPLRLKTCQRPVEVNGKIHYAKTLCPIADRCEMREHRIKKMKIECKIPTRLKYGTYWQMKKIRFKKKLRRPKSTWCCDAIYRTLKKEGFFVVKSGRANIVAIESKERTKDNFDMWGLKLVVFSDPDSGVSTLEEVFVSGFRFGIETLAIKDFKSNDYTTIFSLSHPFGEENEVIFAIGRLVAILEHGELNLIKKLDKAKRERYINFLKELADELGIQI
jgi:hypothetical protein